VIIDDDDSRQPFSPRAVTGSDRLAAVTAGLGM
jgi:hypothetical protein